MKLGLMSAALPGLSLTELITWSAANGYQMLELACWPVGRSDRRYSGVTHVDVTSLSATQASEIRAEVAEAGLQISSLGYYPNPMTPDADLRHGIHDHLRKVILAAELMEVPVVGTFAGRDKTKNLDENFAAFGDVWKPLVRFAADHGVKIAIENCPMIFSYDEWPGGNNLAISPSVWRRMFEIIPDENFGLNLDPSHLIWQFIDPVRAIHEFKDRIFHTHAKDLRVDNEGLYQNGILSAGIGWQIPRLPGFGQVDWARFIGGLYEVGYDYVLSVEHEDRAFEGTEDLVKRGFLIARDVLKPYLY
jgi:sugar phosphate isomerase/epimerase